jgi:hypothetical protein
MLRTAAALAGDGFIQRSTRAWARCRTSTPTTIWTGGPVPTPIADLRRRLADAGAVLFCTPRYAGSLPESFKNLLTGRVGGQDALRTVLGYTGRGIVAPRADGSRHREPHSEPTGVITDG